MITRSNIYKFKKKKKNNIAKKKDLKARMLIKIISINKLYSKEIISTAFEDDVNRIGVLWGNDLNNPDRIILNTEEAIMLYECNVEILEIISWNLFQQIERGLRNIPNSITRKYKCKRNVAPSPNFLPFQNYQFNPRLKISDMVVY